jgi:cell division protein FtsB
MCEQQFYENRALKARIATLEAELEKRLARNVQHAARIKDLKAALLAEADAWEGEGNFKTRFTLEDCRRRAVKLRALAGKGDE